MKEVGSHTCSWAIMIAAEISSSDYFSHLSLAFNAASTAGSESGSKSACDVGSFYTCSRAQFDLMVKGSGIRELRY
jgi:hypothetical protein